MVFSEKDLQRVADDIDKNRRITASIYCGQCGYNLKTLPYRYQCPECGNDYNARPLHLKGIHQPHDISFPFFYLMTALMFGGFAVLVAYPAISPVDAERLTVAGILALAGLIVAWMTYNRILRMIHAIQLQQRINEAERNARS